MSPDSARCGQFCETRPHWSVFKGQTRLVCCHFQNGTMSYFYSSVELFTRFQDSWCNFINKNLKVESKLLAKLESFFKLKQLWCNHFYLRRGVLFSRHLVFSFLRFSAKWMFLLIQKRSTYSRKRCCYNRNSKRCKAPNCWTIVTLFSPRQVFRCSINHSIHKDTTNLGLLYSFLHY